MDQHNIIKLIKASENLPQIPKDFGEIVNMFSKPNDYDLNLCVEYFSRFPELETVLIRELNYISKLEKKIQTIKEAINYLGAKNSALIIIAYVTRLLIPDKNGRTKIFDNKKYWKHCLATSMAAYMISAETKLSDKDKMFTYGLIHDIGITVLDICLPDYLDEINEMHLKGTHQLIAEKIVLDGITHAEIGSWICKEWGLPDEILDIVGFHHTPMLANRNVDEVRIMHLADSISTNYYERLLGNNTTFIYTNKIMETLNINKAFIDYIIEKIPSEVDKLNRIIIF
ncbi:HDOD domain-containing protein [Lachnospiraceae bacterium MD1]|jgi:HD-like signal output (HDOD) protein|uniref:HDOD domain-containing protein n=1 Tax=Variimorphobacter saccharofermentans TaxID=2755051 RepID=A0A839K041_9FIRM|nr:HDOD domain-containing protein [Variimorphobacter saccharofermentans]MBB2183293.1 HDOD domain-containing protein [Variimorphobacter saccharofermentans]